MRNFRPIVFLSVFLASAAGSGAWAADHGVPASPTAAGAFKAQYDGPPGGMYESGAPDGGGYGDPQGPGQGGYGPPRMMRPGYRGTTHKPSGAYITYHGFKIDLVDGGRGGDPSNAVALAEHQIDIVDRVGLSTSTLQLFRGLPVRVSNQIWGGGHFSGGREVTIGGATASDDRPILLHEYLHAYHWFRMPGGFRNADIMHFYQEAVSGNLYESNAYMMRNASEFFAVTASCYLNGTVAREPYNRETIRERQPDYYAYLSRMFGRAGA